MKISELTFSLTPKKLLTKLDLFDIFKKIRIGTISGENSYISINKIKDISEVCLKLKKPESVLKTFWKIDTISDMLGYRPENIRFSPFGFEYLDFHVNLYELTKKDSNGSNTSREQVKIYLKPSGFLEDKVCPEVVWEEIPIMNFSKFDSRKIALAYCNIICDQFHNQKWKEYDTVVKGKVIGPDPKFKDTMHICYDYNNLGVRFSAISSIELLEHMNRYNLCKSTHELRGRYRGCHDSLRYISCKVIKDNPKLALKTKVEEPLKTETLNNSLVSL